MTTIPAPQKPPGTAQSGLFATNRRDRWWLAPGLQATLFSTFVVYSLFTSLVWTQAFGVPYEVDGYLSPFFSPLIAPAFLPTWLSPAILILWIPLGFRATCYYYRKAYYRFYLADPPGCAVGEPTVHRRYSMENRLPFILQNLHRLFLYLAFIPLFFLWLDVGLSVVHGGHVRVGLGTVILLVNVILLSGYSMSCHSLRHLIGGRLDCFSCSANTRIRLGFWRWSTSMNSHHMAWAWASLISVGASDLYIRLLGLGVLVDPAIRF